jgi:hypothetical protein
MISMLSSSVVDLRFETQYCQTKDYQIRGLVMYLTRNLTPEASGALQADQSVTIHGSGTVDEK